MELDRAEQTCTTALDLRYLRNTWDNEVTDDSLRISSPMLRKLLVDGHLQRAWRAAGFDREPHIIGSSLENALTRIDASTFRFVMLGGATHRGVIVETTIISDRFDTPATEFFAIRRAAKNETLRLSTFVDAPCIVVLGRPISRRLLIQYIANVVGGTHYGSKGDQGAKADDYELLEKVRKQIYVAEKPAVYFELLSAGQAISRSPDIARLEETILRPQ